MASAFSVCALSENWRVIVPHGPGGNEAHGINVKDPGWYVQQTSRRIMSDFTESSGRIMKLLGSHIVARDPDG